jgi:hypothetical protein
MQALFFHLLCGFVVFYDGDFLFTFDWQMLDGRWIPLFVLLSFLLESDLLVVLLIMHRRGEGMGIATDPHLHGPASTPRLPIDECQ